MGCGPNTNAAAKNDPAPTSKTGTNPTTNPSAMEPGKAVADPSANTPIKPQANPPSSSSPNPSSVNPVYPPANPLVNPPVNPQPNPSASPPEKIEAKKENAVPNNEKSPEKIPEKKEEKEVPSKPGEGLPASPAVNNKDPTSAQENKDAFSGIAKPAPPPSGARKALPPDPSKFEEKAGEDMMDVKPAPPPPPPVQEKKEEEVVEHGGKREGKDEPDKKDPLSILAEKGFQWAIPDDEDNERPHPVKNLVILGALNIAAQQHIGGLNAKPADSAEVGKIDAVPAPDISAPQELPKDDIIARNSPPKEGEIGASVGPVANPPTDEKKEESGF